MAKGYSSIIAKYDDRYFENWIRFISEQFILWEGDKRIVILTEDGDEEIVELLSVELGFFGKSTRSLSSFEILGGEQLLPGFCKT